MTSTFGFEHALSINDPILNLYADDEAETQMKTINYEELAPKHKRQPTKPVSQQNDTTF